MAVIYARELTRWGIETSIIVPGAFTGGTNHFAHSGRPADEARVAEYEAGPNKGLSEKILATLGAIVPPDADASAVAEASSRWWMRPSANGLSGSISTLPKMEPMLALLSWTASAQKCCIDSASEICSFQQRALQNSCHGGVEMWRGGGRLSISGSAPFVWRCLTGSAMAPFPHPAHRTGRVDFPHPALGQDLTPSPTARCTRARSGVRDRNARRGARVDKSRPCVA